MSVLLLLGLAIAPGLAICLYFFYKDLHREPPATLVAGFFLGVLTTLPALVLELATESVLEKDITGTILSSFFFVALIEECCKFLPLRYHALSRPSFDEPVDGIVHGVMIAMGFATLENIGYVLEHGMTTGWVRMFTSVPGHACFGVMMGYYAGLAKFDRRRRTVLLLKGILLATFFHGAYDACLFLTRLLSDGWAALILVAGAAASFVCAVALSRRLLRLHRATSEALFHRQPVLSIRPATLHDATLIRDLARQIWPQTYGHILSRKQIRYMLAKMYSEHVLQQQMQSGHQFFLLHNAGIPVGFAGFSELEPGTYKLHKIYVLPHQQGRGCGRFLMEEVVKSVRSRGGLALQLNVNRHNKAKEFYKHLGFTILREENIDIGKGYFMNDYVMEWQLVNEPQPVDNKELV